MLYNVNKQYNEDMYTVSLLEDVDTLLEYVDINTIEDRLQYNLAYDYCNTLIENYIDTGNTEYIEMILNEEDIGKLSTENLIQKHYRLFKSISTLEKKLGLGQPHSAVRIASNPDLVTRLENQKRAARAVDYELKTREAAHNVASRGLDPFIIELRTRPSGLIAIKKGAGSNEKTFLSDLNSSGKKFGLKKMNTHFSKSGSDFEKTASSYKDPTHFYIDMNNGKVIEYDDEIKKNKDILAHGINDRGLIDNPSLYVSTHNIPNKEDNYFEKKAKKLHDLVKNNPKQMAALSAIIALDTGLYAYKKYKDNKVAKQMEQIKQQAENKPKSWIGKKIAALRGLYSNYLNKARQAHNAGQSGFFQNIARVILNCIDWLMNKLQHMAG